MIVFDLDDTLYPEREYYLSGIRAIARAIGAVPPPNTPQPWPLPQEPWPAEWLEIYRDHYPEITLRPTMRYLLATLQNTGQRMAIITDGRSRSQRLKYRALGLDRYIPPARLLISEEYGADKLRPDMWLAIMREYPDESRWVYIGDNPAKDFYQPNAMGWTTVMLTDPTIPYIHPQTLPGKAAPKKTCLLTPNITENFDVCRKMCTFVK